VFDFTRVALPQNRYSAAGPYWFDDLKQAYDYPAYASAAGAGATIAIVISSDISDSDLAAYFGNERFSAISGAPVPSVIRRPVLGGAPFDPTSDASLEASVDVQQSLGSAPGARLVLYDIPDQYDDAILAGYTDVVEDDAADVVSSSFGACEQLYTAAYNGGDDETGYLHAEHDLFLQGNAQGQTFVAASGDNAALGCPSLSYFFTGTGIFQKGIQAPASDPDVTAVGGTNLVTASKPGKLDAQYVSENAIGNKIEPEDLYGIGRGPGASGGVFGSGSGASVIWPKPAYQKLLATGAPTRAIPDVSMHMGGCPEFSLYACPPTDSAAVVILGGSAYGVIGTSLSAPEFAGLLALRVAAFGERLGNVNPSLYELAVANDALPYHEYHTRIAGFNGFVTVSDAPRAYNPIIGLGTPYAKNIIGLPNVQSAGTPQTLTNP
jgi:subtilase family serine protease